MNLFRSHREKWPTAYGFLSGILGTIGVLLLIAGVLRLFHMECDERYPFLNPDTRCSQTDSFMRSYEEFETDLTEWIEDEKKDGAITDAAIYFRDLQNGPWFGVRESEQFLPGSLFKVPVMIAMLRAAEQDPSLLTEKLAISQVNTVPSDDIDPSHTLTPGTYYTIDELLRRMIVYSDNASMDLLTKRLAALGHGQDVVQQLYSDLGVLPAENAQTISVKSYSSLFRILYNSRYLTRDDSEKAMSLLASSDFTHGIVAGVPPGIRVAHKYGVHNLKGDQLFHDCGIIFNTTRPYLLCIMTRGTNIESNIRFIAEVSRRVYEQVQQNTSKSW
jgi:beta-lactamase class A